MMYDHHRYDWLKEAMLCDKFRKEARAILDERQRDIVWSLFMDPVASRAEVSDAMMITKERVRQLLSLAEFKLRKIRITCNVKRSKHEQ